MNERIELVGDSKDIAKDIAGAIEITIGMNLLLRNGWDPELTGDDGPGGWWLRVKGQEPFFAATIVEVVRQGVAHHKAAHQKPEKSERCMKWSSTRRVLDTHHEPHTRYGIDIRDITDRLVASIPVFHVASNETYHNEEALKLIVAAPELREALEEAMDCILECSCGTTCNGTCRYSKINALIVAAGGKQRP